MIERNVSRSPTPAFAMDRERSAHKYGRLSSPLFSDMCSSRVLQRISYLQGRFEHLIERGVRNGVKVEVQIIRPVHVVTLRVPLIQIDASQVNDPEQAGEIIDNREVDDVSRSVLNRADVHPIGLARRRAFMKKNSPAIPFGYRFITIARSHKCGIRTSETSA